MATSERKTSVIWKFFSVAEDSKFAVCGKCQVCVARDGTTTKLFSTSNLVQHLQTNHPEVYKEYLEKKANQGPKQLKETRKRSLHRQRFVSKLNIVCFFSFVGDIFYYYSKYSYDISDRLVTSALKDSHLSAIGTSANILHRCNSRGKVRIWLSIMLIL